MQKRYFRSILLHVSISFVFTSSCQHLPFFAKSDRDLSEIELRKVNSDLYPDKLSRSQYYFDIGLAHAKEGYQQRAIENFRLAILHDPEMAVAYIELARVYESIGRFALAIEQIDMFISKTWPNEAELEFITNVYLRSGSIQKALDFQSKAHVRTGDEVHLWKKYEILTDAGQFEQLGSVVEELEKSQADPRLLNLAHAEVAIRKKDFTTAIDRLEMADQLKPNEEPNLRWRVRLNLEAGQFDRSVQLGLRYNRYHNFNLEVSEILTLAAIELKKFDIAIAELVKQKKAVPWNSSLDYQIAYIHFLKQDYDKSESLYADIFTSTDSEESLFYLTQIELAQENVGAAKKLARQLASWSDYYPMVQVQIARLDWQNGKRDQALNRVGLAHRERPDSIELFHEYAQYLIWNQSYVEAIALIEKAKGLYPQDLDLRLLASYVHFTLDNQDKFLSEISYVIERDPNNAEIYSMLTQLYYKKNRSPEQIEYLAKKALELQSSEADVKPILAWALLKQDKFTESIKYLEELYDKNPKEIFFAKALADLYHRNELTTKTKEMTRRTASLVLEETFKSKGAYVDKLRQKVKLSSLPLVFLNKKRDAIAPLQMGPTQESLKQVQKPIEPAHELWQAKEELKEASDGRQPASEESSLQKQPVGEGSTDRRSKDEISNKESSNEESSNEESSNEESSNALPEKKLK